MSSSEGPPEYELATSPLQMLAGVVITLSAHLEASAQLLREESKLTADCRSTPRSLRFYAFSNSRKSATALPSREEILEVVLDIAIESDTMEAEAQALALIFLNRALLSSAVRANTALLLLPGNWELLWLSCVILSAKSYYDAAVFNDDFESCLRGEMTISQMREAEASLLHDALGWAPARAASTSSASSARRNSRIRRGSSRRSPAPPARAAPPPTTTTTTATAPMRGPTASARIDMKNPWMRVA